MLNYSDEERVQEQGWVLFWEWWRGATQSLRLHLSKNSQILTLQHFFYKNVFSLFIKSENSHTVGETDRKKVLPVKIIKFMSFNISQNSIFTYLYLTIRRTDATFQITDALWSCLILHSTMWLLSRKLPCNWNLQTFQEQHLFWPDCLRKGDINIAGNDKKSSGKGIMKTVPHKTLCCQP